MAPFPPLFLRLLALSACLAATWSGCRPSAPKTWEERTTAARDEPWYRQHLLDAYEAAGTKDPRWDRSMQRLLEDVASHRARAAVKPSARLLKRLEAVEREGCTDPLFYYLCARYDRFRGNAGRRHIDHVTAHLAMRKSRYCALEKFFAAWRAGAQLERSDPSGSRQYYAEGIDLLKAALADPTLLPREAGGASRLALNNLGFLDERELLRRAAQEILPILLERWPHDPDVLRSVGIGHLELAWAARGGGWASEVTSEGWAQFAEHLPAAARALEESWALAPHPDTATEMMSVELGQGEGRARLELWFQRAMQLDPANELACGRKVRYLEPRWYGSERELFEFGWECATNPAWQGHVPLAGISAMLNLADEYPEKERGAFWLRPEVWKVVRASYERYFQLNPDDKGTRQAYVKDAYRSRAWKDLNRQLKLMECASMEYFGGEEAFREIVEEAMAHQ